jgi:hypothetical protein
MYVNQTHSNWDAHLQSSVSAYNASFQSSIGCSPYEVVFGRKPSIVAVVDLASGKAQLIHFNRLHPYRARVGFEYVSGSSSSAADDREVPSIPTDPAEITVDPVLSSLLLLRFLLGSAVADIDDETSSSSSETSDVDEETTSSSPSSAWSSVSDMRTLKWMQVGSLRVRSLAWIRAWREE